MKIEVGSEWISDSDSSMEFLVLEAGNTDDCSVKYEVYSNGNYMGKSESNKYTFLFSKSPIISIQEQAYNEGFVEGYNQHEYETYQKLSEKEKVLKAEAWDEGYDQAIDDLIEAGVIGEDEEYSDEEYSEYKFGAVEDNEEEYCFSKELDKVKEGGCVFILDGKVVGDRIKDSNSLDEYNRGYEDGKSRGITLGYNKRDYEESRVGGIDGSERKHSHYFKDVRHLDYVDIYQICKLFPVDDDSGAIVHARKKLLVAGGRGAGKDMIKDITEARDTLSRYLQIEGYE